MKYFMILFWFSEAHHVNYRLHKYFTYRIICTMFISCWVVELPINIHRQPSHAALDHRVASSAVKMSSSNFAEQSELLRRRLDTVANAPTLSPSPFPFTKEDRDFSEIFSYSVSLGNRLIIGAIILTRLWRYHKSGVLRWSELKTKFHVLLIFTVRLTFFNLNSWY